MNPIIKKTIALVASLAIAALAVYGTYLPMRKSQAFIRALNELQNADSISKLEETLSVPLDLPSPIGQEEIVRNIANTVMGYVDKNSAVADDVVKYVRNYFDPIIARGRGMSFTQDLFLLGTIHEIALQRTQQAKYFPAMMEYYLEGNSLSPKRPQFLYRLFSAYQLEGNIEEAKKIGTQILSQWPEHSEMRAALESLEKKK